MKTGISAAIPRFIEQHIVADDPCPERSWLDGQDMPRQQLDSTAAFQDFPSCRWLHFLAGRHFGHRRSHPFNKLRGRHNEPVHHDEDTPADVSEWL